MLYVEIATCRACHSANLKPVLEFGVPYISDFILVGGQENKAPLELVMCQDCSLLQLKHTVDRERLFRTYYYRSGTNESMVESLRDIAKTALRLVPNGKNVLDIGANDGTLLRMFPSSWDRHGYEPSEIALDSLGRDDIRMTPDFWPGKERDQYDVITSIACFYDVDDPNAFVAAIKDSLTPDGVWICQMQDLHGMLSTNGFDNICHEHLAYWSMPAFDDLLRPHGLHISSVQHNGTNGSSIRYTVTHGSRPREKRGIGVHEYTVQMGSFAYEINRLRFNTRSLLTDLTDAGKLVLGYGASTKGNTLLQYYGITSRMIPFIADRNPDKWGREMVGTHIPIISEDEMRLMRPDYLFVLPWHFIDSFLERETEFLNRGGKFIVPLPYLQIVGGDKCRQLYQEEGLVKLSDKTTSEIL